MKNAFKAFGVIALAAVIVFISAACSNGGGNPNAAQSVGYTGRADGRDYTLKITENTKRAAYTPQKGDTYILTIFLNYTDTFTSTGTVTASGSTFTLQPSIKGADSFTVTVSGSNLTAMTGTITWDDLNWDGSDYEKTKAPTALKPKTPSSVTYSMGAFLVAPKDFNPIYDSGTNIPAWQQGKLYYIPLSSKAELLTLISWDTITNQFDGDERVGLSFSEVKEMLENNIWWWDGGQALPNHINFKNCFSGDSADIISKLEDKDYVAISADKIDYDEMPYYKDLVFLFYAYKE
jgi:hypothetical protein